MPRRGVLKTFVLCLLGGASVWCSSRGNERVWEGFWKEIINQMHACCRHPCTSSPCPKRSLYNPFWLLDPGCFCPPKNNYQLLIPFKQLHIGHVSIILESWLRTPNFPAAEISFNDHAKMTNTLSAKMMSLILVAAKMGFGCLKLRWSQVGKKRPNMLMWHVGNFDLALSCKMRENHVGFISLLWGARAWKPNRSQKLLVESSKYER